jgi:putative RNA 2'-phosphotransferase
MSRELVATSKFLSYVLRHNPAAVGVTLEDGGWIRIDALLAALTQHHRPLDRTVLDQLVAGTDRPGTDKQRFEIHDERIRATHGHSIPVDLHLEPTVPPPILYHGTVARFLTNILTEGLQPRGRTHVHLSGDVRTARTVGARRGDPILLTVDAAGMHHHGIPFYRAANGIWLTRHVPPTWIRRHTPA